METLCFADNVVLNVGTPDFSTAAASWRASTVNLGGTARAIDGASIAVLAPRDLDQRVSFMGMVGDLAVTPADPPARVVVNSNRDRRDFAKCPGYGSGRKPWLDFRRISAANQVSQPMLWRRGYGGDSERRYRG